MSPTFRSLRIPNYRLWASGAIVSNTGTWMQRVAQDWLVLTQLTNNSGVAVGITTGLQFAPMLLLAPVAGTVADRFNRRHVLLATQTTSGLLALVLGALVVTDTAQLWHVYVLAALLGVAAAIDAPARQTFVSELVGTEDLPNAVGLNSASFHAGRLIGPGVAGLLIHWFGTGPVFLINGVTFGAVVISLLRMKIADLRPQPRSTRGRGSVREGLTYVRNRPDILLVLVIVGMVGTFGLNFQMTTALMARLAFDKGSGEYGLLGSVMAVGSLAGALLAARRERPRLRLVIGAAMAFGIFATVSAVMPTYWLFAASLVPVGLASLTLMTVGERRRPAQHDTGHARTCHGAVPGDLHGRHAGRRPAHRLGGRGVRRPLDDPARRHRGDDHRPPGGGVAPADRQASSRRAVGIHAPARRRQWEPPTSASRVAHALRRSGAG